MLDIEFLKSLGISEELLPRDSSQLNAAPEAADSGLGAAIAENSGVPVGLTNLKKEELGKLPERPDTQKATFQILGSDGIQAVEIDPEKVVKRF